MELKRREFLGYVGALALTACGTTQVHNRQADSNPRPAAKRLKTRPVISGNLRPYRAKGWVQDLDEEAALGFNLLWLSHASSALQSPPPADPLGELFDMCAKRQVEVILATEATGNWSTTQDLKQELKVVGESIKAYAERYGDRPAFTSWYVPHEIYSDAGHEGKDIHKFINELYPAIVEMCKKATPGKPVTLSPFFVLDKHKVFGNYPYIEPEEYQRYWAKLIRRSGFDVIMLQDSGEHFSYVTDEQRRPFFAAMQAACQEGGAHLWGNVEVAEAVCPSIEEYIKRYGRIHHSKVKDMPWRAVPIERLESKLSLAAEYSERIVSWGYYQFGPPGIRSRGGPNGISSISDMPSGSWPKRPQRAPSKSYDGGRNQPTEAAWDRMGSSVRRPRPPR